MSGLKTADLFFFEKVERDFFLGSHKSLSILLESPFPEVKVGGKIVIFYELFGIFQVHCGVRDEKERHLSPISFSNALENDCKVT